jgi:hypothetical protein
MAASLIVNTSFPKPRESQSKTVKIVRTDTTAFNAAFLPRGAVVTGIWVNGYVASDATTTAVISVGTTTSANEILASFDVKTAATGEGFSAGGAAVVGTYLNEKLTADAQIYAKYAETGTASTTGGPWFVRIDYTVVGPGEDIQM